MAPLRVSTTKSEWLPDDPTAFVPTRLWKLPFITTWDDSRNQNRPTDSAEEAFLPKLRIPPKLWGGPPGPRGSPWTRFSPMKSASSTLRRADGGVGCGPGVRPTINADCAVLGKVCGIRQDCLPHLAQGGALCHDYRRQRLLEIGQQIAPVLDPHRNPHP